MRKFVESCYHKKSIHGLQFRLNSRHRLHSFASTVIFLHYKNQRQIHDSSSKELSDTLPKSIQNATTTNTFLQETPNEEVHSMQLRELAPLDRVPWAPVISEKLDQLRRCEGAQSPAVSLRIADPEAYVCVATLVTASGKAEISEGAPDSLAKR